MQVETKGGLRDVASPSPAEPRNTTPATREPAGQSRKPVMQSAKADAPKGPEKTPPADGSEEAKKQENTRALRLAAGLYAGTSAGMGLVTWGLNSILPTPAMRAIEPMVFATQNVLGGSGARFNDWWTNMVRSFVFRFVKGDNADAKVDNTQGKLLYPALAEDFVRQYTRRSQLDSRKSGQTDTFVTYEVQMMMTAKPVKERLDAGDMKTAARMLAAQLFHDQTFWYEYSPTSTNVYELLYVRLHPYFRRLDDAQKKDLQAQVHAEVERLSAAAKDKPLNLKYADAIMSGLVNDAETRRAMQPKKPEKPLPGLPTDGKPLDVSARNALAAAAANTDAIVAMQKPGVASALTGAWESVKNVFGKRENKLVLISVGAFAAVGAISGVGKFFLGQAVSPAVMTALNAIIFTQVGLFMGVAGAFFQDKYGSWTRSFSYRGAKKTESLGAELEDELLENLFRTLAQDGRIGGTRAVLTMFELVMHNAVVASARCVREGDLEGAAEFLSGLMRYGRTMFFGFSPLLNEMKLAFTKLGPHFDGCTAEQRDRLIELTKADIAKYVAADDPTLKGYFEPFVTGLLTTNVMPATAVAAAMA